VASDSTTTSISLSLASNIGLGLTSAKLGFVLMTLSSNSLKEAYVIDLTIDSSRYSFSFRSKSSGMIATSTSACLAATFAEINSTPC